MTSRIGDFAHHRLMGNLMVGAQARVRETQAQLGSGARAERFRDPGGDAGRMLAAKEVLHRNERYVHNNRLVDARLDVMEDSASSLIEIGTRLRTLLIQRQSDASAVPGVLTVEAEQLLEEAVGALNAKFNGRYLFAGSRTETAPVALDPAFADLGQPDGTYYRGDGVVLSVRADEDIEIDYGVTADAPGFQRLIGALRAAIEGDRTGDAGLLGESLALVNEALPAIEESRGQIGGRRAMLERVNAAHEAPRPAAGHAGGRDAHPVAPAGPEPCQLPPLAARARAHRHRETTEKREGNPMGHEEGAPARGAGREPPAAVLQTRFGPVALDEDRVIAFDDGLLGFAGRRRCLLTDLPEGRRGPFKLLQARTTPRWRSRSCRWTPSAGRSPGPTSPRPATGSASPSPTSRCSAW